MVTGASSGIGRELAVVLNRKGARSVKSNDQYRFFLLQIPFHPLEPREKTEEKKQLTSDPLLRNFVYKTNLNKTHFSIT